jgi:hypothetical protein
VACSRANFINLCHSREMGVLIMKDLTFTALFKAGFGYVFRVSASDSTLSFP